jgi:hypothetical protein
MIRSLALAHDIAPDGPLAGSAALTGAMPLC